MNEQKNLLAGVWISYPAYLAGELKVINVRSFTQHLASILAIGPIYYYTIHISDYSLQHPVDTILSIHGLETYPNTLQEIINLIHPDDIDFVITAEKAVSQERKKIGFKQQLNLKTSYCFRMRVADFSYHLFHHQAVFLAKDDKDQLTTVLHIHTDIQHITAINNRNVYIDGIGNRNGVCQIDLSKKNINNTAFYLSKRESEVLELLALGLSSNQIAERLFISEQTVRVHRKHLLKKTQTTNCSNLINKCIEMNLL